MAPNGYTLWAKYMCSCMSFSNKNNRWNTFFREEYYLGSGQDKPDEIAEQKWKVQKTSKNRTGLTRSHLRAISGLIADKKRDNMSVQGNILNQSI